MLETIWHWIQSHSNLWVLIGLIGQALFMMRFVAQWFASERSQRSVVPEVFWYFSLGGGLILLAYAIKRNDPVFIIGQATGLFIYIRNVVFIWRARFKRRATTHEAVYEELMAKASALSNRHKVGDPITHEERKAAHDALQALEAVKKH
jgi:lipid-A-disaccharide synthase-like uncharacterized protein